MSAVDAQLQFAGEFALFLAAAAGLAYVLTRPDLVVRGQLERILFGLGCGCLAAAAFLAGALIVEPSTAGGLAGLRVAGLVLLARASLQWADGARTRMVLLLSLAVLAGGEAIGTTSENAAEVARLVGAIGLVSALVTVSRRSIPARIAAGSTALLLVVVLAVAVALSAVLADTTEDEAVRRTEAQAAAQSSVVEEQTSVALNSAGSLVRVLDSRTAEGTVRALFDGQPADPGYAEAAAGVQDIINVLDEAFLARPAGPMAYVTDDRVMVAVVGIPTDALRQRIAGAGFVSAVLEEGREVGSVEVIDDTAYALAALPVTVTVDGVEQVAGAALAGVLLDENYLARVTLATAEGSAAIVGPDGVLATHGDQPPASTLVRLADQVFGGASSASSTTGGRFAVAVQVPESGAPVAVLVSSVPAESIEDTRNQLFRTLFVIALVAALVAIAVAAALGNRIGAGISRLTLAAEHMGAGRLDVVAEVDTEDELGVLATTFNTMAGSISAMTGDLRSAAEEEARLRNRVEAVIAGMGEALVAVDAGGLVTDLNRAAYHLLGLDSGIVGSSLEGVVHLTDEDGNDHTDRLQGSFDDGWSLSGWLTSGEASEPVPVAVTAGPLLDADGTRTGAVYVIRDMRREREIERMKTEFLANIGHELRTPLTPIKGYSGMLASRDLPADKVRSFAHEIRAGAEQMERVVGQLVNFATIAAGRLDMQVGSVPVADLLQRAGDRWSSKTDEHQIRVEIEDGVPAVRGDARYLDQTLDELIDNAIKYSPEGGDISLVATAVNNGMGDRVAITVADSGIGIEPERMEEVFGDFAQGDGSATRRFGGLGIGLSLVTHILRAHDADLDCESVPGQGTTFTMTLHPAEGPLAEVATDESPPAEAVTTQRPPAEAPPDRATTAEVPARRRSRPIRARRIPRLKPGGGEQ